MCNKTQFSDKLFQDNQIVDIKKIYVHVVDLQKEYRGTVNNPRNRMLKFFFFILKFSMQVKIKKLDKIMQSKNG